MNPNANPPVASRPPNGIDPGEWTVLQGLLPLQTHDHGWLYFKEGDPSPKDSHAVYLVVAGQVDIVSAGAGGRVPIVRTMGPGDFFGLVGFWVTNKLTATCQANGRTTTAPLTEAWLAKLAHTQPTLHVKLQWAMANQLARDLRACNDRLLQALERTARRP